ncbi:MAG: DNA methyltransferase [Halanaeroarchaeum sp.]
MQTWLTLQYSHSEDLALGDDEIRTPDALVEEFLRRHSEPGDAVFDPFAGYGTTLTVAERLDRVPYGLEYDAERVEHVRERVAHPEHVREGDARELDPAAFPACELCVTSPPFMEQTDERNPFENYGGESSYDRYLDNVESVFARVDDVLAPEGTVVVDVANMKYQGRVTTLAWDVVDRLSRVFDFDGEVVVGWNDPDADDDADEFGYGYDHSYALVFSKAGD